MKSIDEPAAPGPGAANPVVSATSAQSPILPVNRPGQLEGPELRRAMEFVTAAWVFGSMWVTATSGAPFTRFAKAMGVTNFQFGLLSAMPFLAALLSLPASVLIERTGRRKLIFLIGTYTQRAMWAVIAVAPPVLLAVSGNRLAGWVFLTLVFLMYGFGAFGGPAWVSWMADVVPPRMRGKYFGRRRQLGLISGIPVALGVGWLLDRAGGHGDVVFWCAIVFVSAAVAGIAEISLFHPVPELAMQPRANLPLREILRQPLRDRQFLWFAGFVATIVFAISFMGQFVTLFLMNRVGVDDTGVQMMLLVAPMLAQLFVFPVWGRVVDRMGKKPVLLIGALGLVPVGLGWCFMTPDRAWLGYVLSALGAAFWTGVEVANFNLILEFSGSGSDDANGAASRPRPGTRRAASRGSNYTAVNTLIISIAGASGGLFSGLIAKYLAGLNWTPAAWVGTVTYFEVLFAASALLRLLAVVIFIPHVHEPAAGTTGEALRFMTANIYNNLYNSLMQPVRLFRRIAP